MLNSQTGAWLDLPLDARLVIPEKTCVKVVLETADPGGFGRPVKQAAGTR